MPFHKSRHRYAALFVPLAVGLAIVSWPSGGLASTERALKPADNPDVLVPGNKLERNLRALDRTTPHGAGLGIKPWAGALWPTASGLVAARYADPGFQRLGTWDERYRYVQAHPPTEFLSEPDPARRESLIDELSPAEKYDLLVGDDQFTLTRAQWSEGARQQAKLGKIPPWSGICEGSAAASVELPEPKHDVTLITARGESVRFHIMDLKALMTLLWSAYGTELPIAGSRCEADKPTRDGKGIITDPTCFDPNPGAWHVAVLSLVGREQQPLFINRVRGPEIWNVPLIAYELKYFNPKNGHQNDRWEKARIALKDFPEDRFAGYRSPGTVALVGVQMKVRLASGYTGSRDSERDSGLSDAIYRYDLELDDGDDIQGGEWYDDSHPDFIWSVPAGYRTHSAGDLVLGRDARWEDGAVPASWLQAVRLASQGNQLLDAVAGRLSALSTQ